MVTKISEDKDRKCKLMAEVYRRLPDAPVQLHVVTPQQYERWYKRFLGENVEYVQSTPPGS